VRTYVAIVALFALAASFAVLGSWQLRRAELNRSTRAQFASGAAEQAVELPRELDDALRFRRVEVRGELVAEPQFLLDNMLHDGVAGYHVLTALRVAGRSEHVLVNRGWVPAGGDRRRLPDVSIDAGPRTVAGRLERLPRPGMRLGGDDAGNAGAPVAVLQYPTAVELERRLGKPVYDFELLLDAAEPDGFVREWQPPGTPPERNVAYAGQWFALSLGALGVAIVMTFRTVRRRSA
jgi:surfeit locus 1 family protein